MVFAAQDPDLLTWLVELIQLKQDVVAQGLWVGMGLSTVYFMVMLLTRWGDRHTLLKALGFSCLIHLISVAGLVAVVSTPEAPLSDLPPTQEDKTPTTIIQLVSEDPQELPIEGNTPIWNKLPEPVDPLMARIDQANLEPLPLDDPDRQIAPVPKEYESPIPDIDTDLPEENPEVPNPDRVEDDPDPKGPAEIPLDDPEAIAIPDREAPAPNRERNFVPNRGPFESQVRREPKKGATDKVDREIDPNREFSSIETPDDPRAYLKRGPEADQIEDRTSPAPAFGPSPDFGAPDALGPQETPAGEPKVRQPRRLIDRRTEDRINADVERNRSEESLPRERRMDSAPFGPPADRLASRSNPVPVRPRLETPRAGRRVALPSTYRYRGPEQRRDAALKFGGSEASERAVEEALRWLASNQSPEGYWDASDHGAGKVELTKEGLDTRGAEVREGIPGVEADSGVTALAILAFLGAGYTHEEGPYADHVDRGLNWLISQQDEYGFLGGKATYYAKAYCHGMATYALAEAYGMRSDPTLPSPLKEPLQKAIDYILDNQHPSDGGWRYRKGETGDMSIFGWNMMALKSAEIAGLKIPEANRNLLIKFLTDRSLGQNKGLASYHPEFGTQGPTPTMTAEALFSKQMLGLQRTNPASKEAVDYLMTNLPGRENLNFYYWYYGTLAVYQYGGEPWKKWNESLRDMLVDEQRALGKDRGSWDPKDRWGGYGGRVYSTALSALILEVYYRFLPLYQIGDR